MVTKINKKSLIPNRIAVFTFLSFVGIVATFWQTAEKLHLLKYPEDPLSCNINPIVDCGTVLNHNLSAVTGVPNSLLGVLFFVVFFTVGILKLSGVILNKRALTIVFMLSAAMLAFSLWFFAVSLYIITKICIFCVFIWMSAIPIFFLSLSELPIDKKRPGLGIINTLKAHPYRASAVVLLCMVGLFLVKFQDYYFG